MSSGAVVKTGKGPCVCLCEHVGVKGGGGVSLHMCVFRELVLTQTQPLHCPSPSLVRMFEGRLIAWLPLISAGTKKRAAGSPQPSRSLSAPGQERRGEERTREERRGTGQGKVTVENYGAVNYRLLMSCFKIAGCKITHGITLNPPSNPLI